MARLMPRSWALLMVALAFATGSVAGYEWNIRPEKKQPHDRAETHQETGGVEHRPQMVRNLRIGQLFYDLPPWLHDHHDDVEALSTLAIAVLTIATIGVGALQAWLTRQTLVSVSLTSERQLRAYIGVSVGQSEQISDLHGTPTALVIDIKFQNYGQTPAQKVCNWISYGVFEADLPHDFDFPDLDEADVLNWQDNKLSYTDLVPTGSFIAKAIIAHEHVKACRAGKQRIFIWGWCEYTTLTDPTIRRRTEVCYWLVFRAVGPDQAQMKVKQYDRFNGSDGACLKPPQTI